MFKDIAWWQLNQILISMWLTDLCLFLDENKIELHDPIPQLGIQREGDILLIQ